ncbi:hypothetical protein [Pseudomonas botevensis]|uniref:hypothetical protein n=1 Tax=Pseudomonas botevensis TaxID=2842352 RepID=UPI001C3D211F|nr:hypothetical protein [Pseudomonas botevensis]MBV4477846.1 hypothetical protein [Pseudomonas botevensis]
MNIDFSKMITAEQRRAEQFKAQRDAVYAQRRAAYQEESDPLRLEIAYDALSQGLEPDFSPWVTSVAAIKARYPLPDADPA